MSQLRTQCPEFRVSYQKLWQPRDQDGEKRWEVTAIFEPTCDFNSMLQIAQAAKAKHFGAGYAGPCRQPFKTDETRDAADRTNGVDPFSDHGWRKKNPEIVGKVVVSLSSKMQPVIPHHFANGECVPIIDQALFYSGCYAVAMVTAFAYGGGQKKGKDGKTIAPGVSFGLSTIVKTRDGEPLVAIYNAAEDFKGLAANPAYNQAQNAQMFPQQPMQTPMQQPQFPQPGSYTPQQLPPQPGFPQWQAPQPPQQLPPQQLPPPGFGNLGV